MRGCSFGKRVKRRDKVFIVAYKTRRNVSGADPGFLKGGGAPPTFYILKARAHAHHMNRTEHEHLS